MATYTVHILNNAYTTQTVLVNTTNYADILRISYRLALNDVSSCSIRLAPHSSKLTSCVAMNRVLLYRDGVLQFGGLILKNGWAIGVAAEEDAYQIDVLGGEVYLDWRAIEPAALSAYDERTDHADDLAKEYVRHHAASAADDALRQFSDLTVEADEAACTSLTEKPRYENLLEECQKLAKFGAFDFRCVPSTTGFVFTTAYPQWGLDRTFGNGVNTDAVFSLDRRNFSKMTYVKDTLGHYNYLYVAGQGEGADQTIRERSTAGDIASYKRRERFETASAYEDATVIDNIGDMRLKQMAVIQGLTVLPLQRTWKNPWDLGDLVTIRADRYGQTYTTDAKIVAINVDVDEDGTESVTPEMETV